MASADYESVLCVKNQVHVYKIPPRPSNRGYRAADWNLEKPDWTGRLRVVSKGKDLFIKLEDKISGELFAQCPVESYPGVAVEAVTDSSRYFVIRLKDEGGRSAFIGIGFEDRGDSFDLNVALQDHFKWLKNEENAKNAAADLSKGPKLDLGFKEGQTIKINIAGTKKDSSKPRPKGNSMGGILPPPPGGIARMPPPPGGASSQAQVTVGSQSQSFSAQQTVSNSNSNASSNFDLLNFDFDAPASSSSASNNDNVPAQPAQTSNDPWGEFTGASSGSNWVQF